MMNEVILELRSLLQTSMGSRCTAYYAGNVALPMKNELPCVIVREHRTSVDRSSTAKDRYRFKVSVLVVTDIVTSFNEAGLTNRIVESRQKLRKIMEEGDTDGAPKADTVLGCLMKQANLRGVSFIYNQTPEVNYDVESPGEFFYVAAEVTLDLLSDSVSRKA